MADQVAVLRDGVIGQIDTPSGLYGLPRDPELAQFLGEANLLDGAVSGPTWSRRPWGPRSSLAWAGVGQTAAAERVAGPGPGAARAARADSDEARPAWPAWCAATSTSATTPWCGCGPTPGPGSPELVVRVTGGRALGAGEPGRRCGCQGAVVAWPAGENLVPNTWTTARITLPVTTSMWSCSARHERQRSESTGGAMAEESTPEVGRVSTVRRSVRSWASPTASWTIGPAPACCGHRWPRPGGAGPAGSTPTRDVLELKVIKQLLDAGISLQSARQAVECLREDLGATWRRPTWC